MNAEQKAKWLAALRSGEYEQGTGQLGGEYETENSETGYVEVDFLTGFCCLGVLNAACKLGFPGNTEYLVNGSIQADESYKVLPREVQEKLAKMNDGQTGVQGEDDIKQHSFAEIADFIEQEVACTE